MTPRTHDDGPGSWRADRYDVNLQQLDTIPARFRDAITEHPLVLGWIDQALLGGHRWLRLEGPTGTGKTHQAYAALRMILAAGELNSAGGAEAEIVGGIRRLWPSLEAEERLDLYANVDVLLIDDLGASKASEWTEEVLYRLLNRRYEAMLPCLITSNLPTDLLRVHVGDRVASRISEAADVVVLDGPDRRRS